MDNSVLKVGSSLPVLNDLETFVIRLWIRQRVFSRVIHVMSQGRGRRASEVLWKQGNGMSSYLYDLPVSHNQYNHS